MSLMFLTPVCWCLILNMSEFMLIGELRFLPSAVFVERYCMHSWKPFLFPPLSPPRVINTIGRLARTSNACVLYAFETMPKAFVSPDSGSTMIPFMMCPTRSQPVHDENGISRALSARLCSLQNRKQGAFPIFRQRPGGQPCLSLSQTRQQRQRN